jgi:hypothetical protein
VVLYELITGHLPFAGRTAPELVSAICAQQPTPIASLISRAPIELVGVIGRCVHKSRDGRYANVQELARALLPFVRTAASQVSVDRILGIASAPRKLATVVDQVQPLPASITHTIRDGGLRTTRMLRPRSNLTMAVAAVISACAIGWGLAAAFGGGGEPQTIAPTPAGPGTAAALCAAPQANSLTASANECPAPATVQANGAGNSSPAGAVAAPAVGGVTQASGLRRSRQARARDDAADLASEPKAVERVEPSGAHESFDYPSARPLDPHNPYAPR